MRGFSTAGDPQHPHWSLHHPLPSSCPNAPAQGRCDHLHAGNVHKCCFLQATEGERKQRSPRYLREGSRNTLRTTSQGLFARTFGAAFLSARLGWYGKGVVGFGFTEHTPALPCLSSSQEVFCTSSAPTFATQHTRGTELVLSLMLVLLARPCISE